MTLYRATTSDGRADLIDADRLTRARIVAEHHAHQRGATVEAIEPTRADDLTDACHDALGAIAESLGEGVSFTCGEYARVRSLAVIVAPDMLAELDERHASTDDDEDDCAHAAYLALEAIVR